jgi:hypothetical protein
MWLRPWLKALLACLLWFPTLPWLLTLCLLLQLRLLQHQRRGPLRLWPQVLQVLLCTPCVCA